VAEWRNANQVTLCSGGCPSSPRSQRPYVSGMISAGAESLELSRPGCGLVSHDQLQPHSQSSGTGSIHGSRARRVRDLLIGGPRPSIQGHPRDGIRAVGLRWAWREFGREPVGVDRLAPRLAPAGKLGMLQLVIGVDCGPGNHTTCRRLIAGCGQHCSGSLA
jgi:hypothetical protein